MLGIENRSLRAGVAPELGGSITYFDFCSGGEEVPIFRRAVDDRDVRNSPLGMSSFPLVPYCNRLRHGSFTHASHVIRFPLNIPGEKHSSHGDGWTRPWRVLEHKRDSIQLELPVSASAPLRYSARQRIAVDDEALSITFDICNEEQFPVPLGVGVHPYFSQRSGATVAANFDSVWELDEELMPVEMGNNERKNEFSSGFPVEQLTDLVAASAWDGIADITFGDAHLSVHIHTVPKLHHLILWTPVGEQFFCVEPVSHAIDAFNLPDAGGDQQSCHVQQPGEVRTQGFVFRIERTL